MPGSASRFFRWITLFVVLTLSGAQPVKLSTVTTELGDHITAAHTGVKLAMVLPQRSAELPLPLQPLKEPIWLPLAVLRCPGSVWTSEEHYIFEVGPEGLPQTGPTLVGTIELRV